jgi:hypothetical protein
MPVPVPVPPKKAYYVEATVGGKGKRKNKKKMDFKETSPTDALAFLSPEQLESVQRKAMTGAIVVIQAPPPPAPVPLEPQQYMPYGEKGNRKKAPTSSSSTPSTGGQFLSPAMDTSMSELVDMQRQIQKLEEKIRELENKMNKSQVKGQVHNSTQPMALTYDEKIQLSEDIDSLPPEKLGVVMALLQSNIDHSSHDGSTDDIEVSLDDLPPETLRRLQDLVAKEKGEDDTWGEEEDPFFQESKGDMFLEEQGEQVFKDKSKSSSGKKKRNRASTAAKNGSDEQQQQGYAESNGEAPSKRARQTEPESQSSTVAYDFGNDLSSSSSGLSLDAQASMLPSASASDDFGSSEGLFVREEEEGGSLLVAEGGGDREPDLDMSGLDGLDDSFF